MQRIYLRIFQAHFLGKVEPRKYSYYYQKSVCGPGNALLPIHKFLTRFEMVICLSHDFFK